MIWVAVGVVLAVIAAAIYWRWRRRRQPRLISLVALLREPMTLDATVLARVAGKAWQADLGDGNSEGQDGFVAGIGMLNTIMHRNRMYLVNSFAKPYAEELEQVAQSIGDLRIRELFLQHRAWFSCDAMGVDGTTPDAEVKQQYQDLGKLFVQLVDDNCLLIYLPDTSRAYPINDDTEAALLSDNPPVALQETMTVPLVEVAADDPLMVEAVQKARQAWPQFVSAYESQDGEGFSVKAPITRDNHTEFIWISVTALEGERVYGELGNDPANLGPLKLGSKVSVLVDEVNDWCFMDRQGNMTGGFTIEAVAQAARRKRKAGS